MGKSNPSDFLKIMEKHFEFLLNDLGFSIAEPYIQLVELMSENCQVVVIARNNQCSVLIGPLGAATEFLESKNLKTGTIEVEYILKILAPQEKFEQSESIFSFEDIDVEVKRNIVLMKKYCMKMLKGDFSEWELLYK